MKHECDKNIGQRDILESKKDLREKKKTQINQMQGFKHMSSTENPKDMKLFAKNPQFLRSSFCFFFRVIFFFHLSFESPMLFHQRRPLHSRNTKTRISKPWKKIK